MVFRKKGVVYTCITGGYDELLNHTFVHPDWDYVCFSDDLSIRSDNNAQWEIMSLHFDQLDNVRNQRWHKLHPHILFPDYEVSLWLDGNIDILNGNLFNDIDNAMEGNHLIACSLHPKRDCIYKEFEACLQSGKDDKALIEKQEKRIRAKGFPKKQGLFETGIIFRRHVSPAVVQVMEDWWIWIEKYSRRDQLSFTYVLWKNNLQANLLSPVSYRENSGISFREGRYHITIDELIKQNEELRAEVQRFKNSIYWQVIKPFHKMKKSIVKRLARMNK